MANNKSNMNKLDHCVRNLKSISRNLSSKTPTQIADLYFSSIGLLCHLKKDQSTLQQLKKNDQAQCPPPKDIPAITAVVQDAALFDALISCLKVSSGTSGGDHDRSEGISSRLGGGHSSASHHHHHHHHPHHHHHHGMSGRKRTNSIPNDDMTHHASKAIKLSHSPTPSAARLFGHGRINHNVVDNKSINSEYNPTLNVRVVAATIIYISFAHLDHWPVPLVRAYAEDCFGPRLWVDDDNCKLLVENLRLVHKSKAKKKGNSKRDGDGGDEDDEDTEMADATVLEDAARVADSYSRVLEFLAAEEDVTQQSNNNSHHLSPGQQPHHHQVVRRGSLSSVSSTGGVTTSTVAALKKSNSKDDDSVVGNGKKPVKRKPPKAKKKSTDDDGASSSSGEEDEEVIVTKKSGGDDAAASSPRKKASDPPPDRQGSPTGSHISSEAGHSSSPPKRRLYPLAQHKLNLLKVRQRYFGINQENAHLAISLALSERLDSKAKQNSALLQSLHSFTSVAGVRSLVAGNLEKWLQSPALSGLARTLFTSTVNNIENVDPPKPPDVEAIYKVLSMRLKANQLSAHIENVRAIASTIPTGTVARQMYHQLLSEVLATMGNSTDTSASDRLKMVGAVYSAFPKGVSADGIAASLLIIIGEAQSAGALPKEKKKGDRKKVMKQVKHLLQLVAQQLGASFDVCKLVESLLSFNVKDRSWKTLEDEEDRARLMFQCVLLLVPAPPKDGSRHNTKSVRKGVALTDSEADVLRKKLSQARKLILTWFCADYGPQFKGSEPPSGDTIGAGLPNFRSVLGGVEGTKLYPPWLKIARCLLFMESGDSPLMQQFVRGNKAIDDKDSTWFEEKYRIDRCYEYGCDFDDDMMWIVLKSASQEDGGIDSQIALTLLEHLFECCNIHRRGSLNLNDIMLAWELYSLVCYEPPETVLMLQEVRAPTSDAPGSKFGDAEEDMTVDNTVMETVRIKTEDLDLPQLAYPGMWWRVTILALVMCGVAPQQIGAPVWEEHPTLRAMIKMVISSRYRFPTVDCDEADRAEMKKSNQLMRDEEARIAETLFLPPKLPPKVEPEIEQNHGRNRISARQQQKRERAQRKRREKEAAEALAEENKRKKMLRGLQKTIILWDPTGGARKPPQGVAELLVAVDSHFSLSKTFQRTVEPDFLLMTIGKTTRDAIERAYDWLIPIISDVPHTIARLHASASCVLLLRAYGTDGDERAQLKQLSAPLLRHVSDSLTGRFGQADAVRAFDLLLSDVASHNPDRRRCARRVLFDSIGKLAASESTGGDAKSSWMLNILQLDHAKWLVGDAIKHMSTAIRFERGLVLRNLLMALDDLIAFAKKNDAEGDLDFASVFIDLVSSRASVCAEALDRFADLRTLAVRTVYREFEKCIMEPSRTDPVIAVLITLYPLSQDKEKEATLSLSLLQAAAVLLSIWTEDNGASLEEDQGNQMGVSLDEKATSYITNLANMLLQPIDSKESDEGLHAEKGLASAKLVQLGTSAVSVESWVMLAKARSSTIARRAALTAPTGFLPRLLLCSGLPRASLLTMIDRLGKLGDASDEQDVVFTRLLIPSAASEWDIGRLGGRRDVARKLLGRLSAYVRMNSVSFSNEDTKISTSFLGWLSRECSASEKPRKQKTKSKSKAVAKGLSTLMEASLVLDTLGDSDGPPGTNFFGDEAEESYEMDTFRPWVETQTALGSKDVPDGEKLRENVQKAIEENQPDQLQLLLQTPLDDKAKAESEGSREWRQLTSLATLTLQTFLKLEHKQDSIARIVTTSVPSLSRMSGSPELWKLIFSNQGGEMDEVLNSLLCRCLTSWCTSHASSCYDWLLRNGKATNASDYSANRVIRFLVLSSGQQSVHMEGFSGKVTVKCVRNWGKSEDFVGASVAFAFEAMKRATLDGFVPSLVSRNELPDWLILIIALAKCGRVQMKYICESVLKRISQPSEKLSLPLLRAVFLRLYVANPQGMNLGTAMIRSTLMEAAQEYSVSWLDWRSPLDDQFQDMLEAVTSGSGQRLVRPLSDMSKKHPLLILRKSNMMTEFLERDASVAGSRRTKELRGVVHGQNLSGPLKAAMSGRFVKVRVKHWGYSYTEFIWIALLDILCSIPGPVLFGCGLSMGFLEFLNVNMRLMYVQSQLRRTERDFRLKDKLKDILATFRKTSRQGWEKWMASTDHGLPTLGEMRNVMICCNFLDPKDVVKQT